MRLSLIPLGLSLIAVPLRAQVGSSADQRALQGDWTMVSATQNGVTYPAIDGTRHVSGDTTTITVNGQLLMRARFTLDPTANPKAIEYEVIEGAAAGAHLHGIYLVADSTLTFCMASPGADRPTEFDSKDGDGRTCSEWKRKP